MNTSQHAQIAKSFANLVEFNNGLFKSEAQAQYLLSCCQEPNVFIATGSVYGNSFTIRYHVQQHGVEGVECVVLVTKDSAKKGVTTQWEPKKPGVLSIAEVKRLKEINRNVKRLEKSIAERQEQFDAGLYVDFNGVGDVDLFNRAMDEERKNLAEWIEIRTTLLESI